MHSSIQNLQSLSNNTRVCICAKRGDIALLHRSTVDVNHRSTKFAFGLATSPISILSQDQGKGSLTPCKKIISKVTVGFVIPNTFSQGTRLSRLTGPKLLVLPAQECSSERQTIPNQGMLLLDMAARYPIRLPGSEWICPQVCKLQCRRNIHRLTTFSAEPHRSTSLGWTSRSLHGCTAHPNCGSSSAYGHWTSLLN